MFLDYLFNVSKQVNIKIRLTYFCIIKNKKCMVKVNLNFYLNLIFKHKILIK